MPRCWRPPNGRSRPLVQQVFALHQSSPLWTPARQERSLYRARVMAEARLAAHALHDAAIVSLSTRTMVYKALVAPVDLDRFYPDLADRRYETTFTVFHQRFSTNTFPQWALAQPFRSLAHNGEINTILGNRLHARRRQADRSAMPDVSSEAGPLVRLHGSDSQSLDDMIEHLRQGGLSLAHAFARVLPRAWEHDPALSARERAFEAYQSTTCEPWEGPAAIAFADGRQVGAVLDRNGFRPARVLTSNDGLVCVGSESGIFDIPEQSVERRGRLGPGEMIVVDLESGRLIDNSGLATDPSLLNTPIASGYSSLSPTFPRTRRRRRRTRRLTELCCISASSATPPKRSNSSSARWSKTARKRSARWATTRRWRC